MVRREAGHWEMAAPWEMTGRWPLVIPLPKLTGWHLLTSPTE
jgi:hypothetical protein